MVLSPEAMSKIASYANTALLALPYFMHKVATPWRCCLLLPGASTAL